MKIKQSDILRLVEKGAFIPKIEQINMDGLVHYEQFKALADDGNVFMLYNAFNTIKNMYERNGSENDCPDFDHCYRLRPFTEFFNQHDEDKFMMLTIRHRYQLIRIDYEIA